MIICYTVPEIWHVTDVIVILALAGQPSGYGATIKMP